MKNLLFPTEVALLDKQFVNGLSSYTQANCQCTVTDKGFRVYRPPNHNGNTSGSGGSNDVWGGLRIQPLNIDPNLLVKGRTYIVMLDVSGKTSNAITSIGWTNNMGWGGGGLNPAPTDVSQDVLPANFEGSKTCWYKFTVADDIYKVCTSAYSSFKQGETYPSYRDFQFGWGYANTGALGTDIYITNIRMYDITENPTITPNKNGILQMGALNEGYSTPAFHQSSEIFGNSFNEF